MPIEPKLCSEYLKRLDFEVSGRGKTLTVTVPVHRHYDVTREVDLVEEVGRIHGYAENLPSTLPATSGQVGRLTREQRLRRRAEDAMRDLGFDAVVNLSLTDPGMPGRLRIPDGDLRAEPIRVSNPLSADHSVERTAMHRLPARRGRLQPCPWRGAGGPVRVRPRLPSRGEPSSAGCPGGEVRGRAAAARLRALADRGAGDRLRSARVDGARTRLRPTSMRSRALSRDWRGSSARRSRSCPAISPSSTRAAVAACWSKARTRAGSARSTRSSAAPGTWRAPRGSRSTWRRWWPPRRSGTKRTRT